jgi:hypothetical protein
MPLRPNASEGCSHTNETTQNLRRRTRQLNPKRKRGSRPFRQNNKNGSRRCKQNNKTCCCFVRSRRKLVGSTLVRIDCVHIPRYVSARKSITWRVTGSSSALHFALGVCVRSCLTMTMTPKRQSFISPTASPAVQSRVLSGPTCAGVPRCQRSLSCHTCQSWMLRYTYGIL